MLPRSDWHETNFVGKITKNGTPIKTPKILRLLPKTTTEAPKYDPLLSRQKATARPQLRFFATTSLALIFGIACGGGIHLASFSTRFRTCASVVGLIVDLSSSSYEFMKKLETWNPLPLMGLVYSLRSQIIGHLALNFVHKRVNSYLRNAL
jgi:hypothetical protein